MKRYEEEFKLMIVHKNKEGQSINSLSKEFNIGLSIIYSWVKMYKDTKSFKREISKMCKLLNISRQTYYRLKKVKNEQSKISKSYIEIDKLLIKEFY